MGKALPVSNRNPVILVHPGGDAGHQVTDFSTAVHRGKWLPAILLGLYYFNSWQPLGVWFEGMRWYMALGLAGLAFLMQGRRLGMKNTKLFWMVQGLAVLGAVISLPRALYPESALWNAVGMQISFVTMLLFVPVLSTKLTRRCMLIALIAAAIFWVIGLQRLRREVGVFLPYSTFYAKRIDKNYLSLCLALASTSLLSFVALWKPSKLLRPWQVFLIRVVLSLSGLYMIYIIVLTYSRSGLLTACVGVLTVLGAKLVQERRLSGVFRMGLIISLIMGGVVLSLSQVLDAAPYWDLMAEPLLNVGDPTLMVSRRHLFDKGLRLIRENPILGVGIEGTKAASLSVDGDSIRGLIHNSYLTAWAELGILGLVSHIAWILAYFKILRTKFFDSPLVDQIWLLLFIPFFFDLNLFDIGSQIVMMTAILAGIYHGQSSNSSKVV